MIFREHITAFSLYLHLKPCQSVLVVLVMDIRSSWRAARKGDGVLTFMRAIFFILIIFKTRFVRNISHRSNLTLKPECDRLHSSFTIERFPTFHNKVSRTQSSPPSFYSLIALLVYHFRKKILKGLLVCASNGCRRCYSVKKASCSFLRNEFACSAHVFVGTKTWLRWPSSKTGL